MSCVSCVRGTTEEATEETEEEDEEEPGVSDQKQKPHTKMWGKRIYPMIYTMIPIDDLLVKNKIHPMMYNMIPIDNSLV